MHNGSREESGSTQICRKPKRWKMAQVAKKRAGENEREDDQARRKIAKDKMQEDMRNGGATAHKAVKIALGAKKEYVQPTHAIQTEEGINSDPNQVHQVFTKEWTNKVFRLQRQKPEWKTFQDNYGEYIPHVPYTHGTINGEDMFKTVQQIGKQCQAWMDGESTS